MRFDRCLHACQRPAAPAAACLLLAVLPLVACTERPALMPTPNIYTRTEINPFSEVPPALRSNRAPILYITDRAPEVSEKSSPDRVRYGADRSRSAAFGISEVQIGGDVSWDQLVRASRSAARPEKLHLSVVSTRELGRFPPTPERLVVSDAELAQTRPTIRPEETRAEERLSAELTERLADSPVKDVYVFVHGFANSFEDSVLTIAQLWHFLGRPGVAVAYSWPAGMSRLRGYNYTRESGEFTIFHLKQALRHLAGCPAVVRIHVIAHSRGTDVASAAIRELHLAAGGTSQTQKTLKLGTLVLAAADLDMDVVIQRLAAERVGRACQQVAIYVCNRDKALGISNWLFSSVQRFGEITSEVFDPDELKVLRRSRRLQIIDARVGDAGSFGHDYFYSNPAVSSDLILLLRYQLPPGGETGRPLTEGESGFWVIDDKYPRHAQWVQEIHRHAAAKQAKTAIER